MQVHFRPGDFSGVTRRAARHRHPQPQTAFHATVRTARVFGSLLTWLNDHESDVFAVGTCNNASKLPPEFARAERFDGVFFADLPSRDQKDAIWGV